MDKGDHAGVPVKTERTRIIADSTPGRMRRLCQLQGLDRLARLLCCLDTLLIGGDLFLPQGEHALDRFGRFDTSRTNQLRRQMCSGTMLSIRQRMQVQAIADLLSISSLAHLVEASGIFLHRLTQECSLLWCGFQLDAYRARCYHVHVVAQCGTKVNHCQVAEVHPTPAPKKEDVLLSCLKVRGFRTSEGI